MKVAAASEELLELFDQLTLRAQHQVLMGALKPRLTPTYSENA